MIEIILKDAVDISYKDAAFKLTCDKTNCMSHRDTYYPQKRSAGTCDIYIEDDIKLQFADTNELMLAISVQDTKKILEIAKSYGFERAEDNKLLCEYCYHDYNVTHSV